MTSNKCSYYPGSPTTLHKLGPRGFALFRVKQPNGADFRRLLVRLLLQTRVESITSLNSRSRSIGRPVSKLHSWKSWAIARWTKESKTLKGKRLIAKMHLVARLSGFQEDICVNFFGVRWCVGAQGHGCSDSGRGRREIRGFHKWVGYFHTWIFSAFNRGFKKI